jgi:hypothetical protein
LPQGLASAKDGEVWTAVERNAQVFAETFERELTKQLLRRFIVTLRNRSATGLFVLTGLKLFHLDLLPM